MEKEKNIRVLFNLLENTEQRVVKKQKKYCK